MSELLPPMGHGPHSRAYSASKESGSKRRLKRKSLGIVCQHNTPSCYLATFQDPNRQTTAHQIHSS